MNEWLHLCETAIKGLYYHLAFLFPSGSNAFSKYKHKSSQLETECGGGLKTGKMPILGIQLQFLSCCFVRQLSLHTGVAVFNFATFVEKEQNWKPNV